MGLGTPVQQDLRQQEGLCGIVLEFCRWVAFKVRMRLLMAEKKLPTFFFDLIELSQKLIHRNSPSLEGSEGRGFDQL
jgi:hypothetical protein